MRIEASNVRVNDVISEDELGDMLAELELMSGERECGNVMIQNLRNFLYFKFILQKYILL